MRRTTSTRSAALALAIAGATALTGCGLIGGEESSEKANSTASAASGKDASSSAPSTPATTESSPSEAEGERPPKDEVKKGLKAFYDRTDTGDTFDHDKMATCVTDRGYDTLTVTTLNALKDGDPTKVDSDDKTKFNAIMVACATESLPSGSGSLPPLPSDLPTDLPSGLPTEMPS